MVYDDLHYRRVCAPVGFGSILCMTVKFPFEVPVQDPTATIPKPFQSKFYELDHNALIFIDNDRAQNCEIETIDMNSMHDAVKRCIETTSQSGNENKVVAIWTRQRQDGTTAFHTTGLRANVETIYKFFGDDHMILVLGMSPSPGVTAEMQSIFQLGQNCQKTGVNKQGNWNCDRPNSRRGRRRRRMGNRPYSALEEGHVNFGQLTYGPQHRMPSQNLTQILDEMNVRTTAARLENPTRTLSLLVEYPLAHTQYESWMRNEPARIHALNTEFSATLSAYLRPDNDGTARDELHRIGFALGTLMVFDGLPQTFPTETGGYVAEIAGTGKGHSAQEFLDLGGYPGWRPELGSNCRGPLPPNSPLKGVVEDIRQIWQDQGLDMRWYGRTFEFSNLFWWQTQQCTSHGAELAVFWRIHSQNFVFLFSNVVWARQR